MVSRADVLRWTTGSEDKSTTLNDALGDDEIIAGDPDDLVGTLADRMARADVGRVPIVDAQRKLLGLIARKDLLGARARLIQYEHERTAPLRERVSG
jgi:CBS domain-containing protein